MQSHNSNDLPAEGSSYYGYKVFFQRIQESLEEARRAESPERFEAAAVKAHACFCAASTCTDGCPIGKEPPKINALLRAVDFEALIKEFSAVMKEIDAEMDKYSHLTHEEYMIKARKGYVMAVNRIIDGKPALKEELIKLKRAFDMQVEKTPFVEFTGTVCPAPCESGGSTGPGCTLKASGAFTSVRIKSIELDLVSIGFVLGWLDEKFVLPASLVQQKQKVVIAGAGPAGLEAAYELAKQGVKVVVYDPQDEIGGLLYRGIPDHKFQKERLIKYRIYLKEMGVEFKLGTPLTKELYELEGNEFGADSTRMIMATGVQHDPIRPTWVEGFNDVAQLQDATGIPKVEAAIDYLNRRNGQVAAGEQYVAEKQCIGIMGAGDTATDAKQSTPRETGFIFAAKEQGHFVVSSDRGIPDANIPRAGTGYGSGNQSEVAQHSSKQEDIQKTGGVSLYGSSPVKFAVTPEDKIAATYSFEKPKFGWSSVAKIDRDRAKEPDLEVGEVRNTENQLIGLRLRGSRNELVDYPLVENPEFPNQFSNQALKNQRLDGVATGTLTMVYDRFYYALNCRGAENHPLAKEFGLQADPKSGILDIKNCRTTTANVYACGDAGTPKSEWIIVAAQQSALVTVRAVSDDIIRQEQEINWQDSREIAASKKQTTLIGRAAITLKELASAAKL